MNVHARADSPPTLREDVLSCVFRRPQYPGRAAGANGSHEIISVYICDDVAALRLVIRTVLELDGDVRVVGEAGDGLTALQDVERLRPDVVVLDLSLPERDGLEVLQALATRAPQTRIIVFSGYAAEQLEATALSLGAHRYVEKGTAIAIVAEAVREAAKEAA